MIVADEFKTMIEEALRHNPAIAIDIVRELIRQGPGRPGIVRQRHRCGEHCSHRRGIAFCAAFNEQIGPGNPPVACPTCLWVFNSDRLRDQLAELP